MADFQPHSSDWRLDLDADDRGPAKYFHGRVQIRSSFAGLLSEAQKGLGGTTFLIQGAPGAGKSALLDVLSKQARASKWHTVNIDAQALHDPVFMAQQLGVKSPQQIQRYVEADARLLKTGRINTEPGALSVRQVLKNAHKSKRGLLLVFDEAQTIGYEPERPRIVQTLNAVHNGQIGRPVILLVGGLGLTKAAFGQLGIPRFQGNCLVNLGRLSPEPEQAVVRDWLEKGGGAQEDVTPWINAITQETDGWPQHIVSFAQPAAQVIRRHKGQMTTEGLTEVLKFGRKRKEEYYLNRSAEISSEDLALLGAYIQYRGRRVRWYRRELVKVLDILERVEGETAADVVDTMLAKGVLAGDFQQYHVPIPSMEDWLQRQFESYLYECPDEGQALTSELAALLSQPAKRLRQSGGLSPDAQVP